jgi:hypothetical protein
MSAGAPIARRRCGALGTIGNRCWRRRRPERGLVIPLSRRRRREARCSPCRRVLPSAADRAEVAFPPIAGPRPAFHAQEPGAPPGVLVAMMYVALPILIALMLAYMFWQTAFRLRRDRLVIARARRKPLNRPKA